MKIAYTENNCLFLRIRERKGFKFSFLPLFFLCVLWALVYEIPILLIPVARIYQRGWRIFNTDYQGLGEEGIVYRFDKGYRFLCYKEYYSKEFETMLLDIENVLNAKGLLLRKHTPASRDVYLLEFDNISYIVKKSYKPSFIEALFYSSRYSRSSWNNAQYACKLGIKTFSPVALIEFGQRLCYHSYLIYPYEGTALEEKKENCEEWLFCLKESLEKQKHLRVIHGDLTRKNVVQLEDGSVQFIDIEDMHFYPRFSYLFYERFAFELALFNRDFFEEGNGAPLEL